MKRLQKHALYVLFALLITAFSCGEISDTKTGDTTLMATEDTLEKSDETIKHEIILPEKDYDGAEFNFIGTGAGLHSGYYVSDDIGVESENGEVFNDALYSRTRAVEEQYNVIIKMTYSEQIANDVSKAVIAGDSGYDAIFGYPSDLYNLALNGYLIDITTLDRIDLNNPWWDANAVKEFGIAGKNYFVTGDISTKDDACTRLTLFNKKLIEEYALDNPYDLVYAGDWTFDRFSSMIREVSVDVDGNGIMEAGDTFGIINEWSLPVFLYYGVGGRYIEPDTNESFTVVAAKEENYDRFSKIITLLSDGKIAAYINKWSDFAGFTNCYTYARSLFTRDRFLFHIGAPLIFSEFREMESEFGIVPLPKYDKNQERYYCPVDIQAPMLSVPLNTPDPERTGMILEAMAAQSMLIVTPEYNETLLKRKYTRDNESAGMLDIIAISRSYDLYAITNWGNLTGIAMDSNKNQTELLLSAYEARLSSVQTEIDKAMAAFNK